MGLTRSNYHKRNLTGGRRIPLRIKRKYDLARPPAQTKLTTNENRVHKVRTRGGHSKFRALRLDAGSFSWSSEAISRQTKILDVVYNATSNELVRTKTLVKGCIVQIDATPFVQWYYQHYGVHLRRASVIKQVPTWLAEKQHNHWLKRHGLISTWNGTKPATPKQKRIADALKKRQSKRKKGKHQVKKHAAWKAQRTALKAAVQARRKALAERRRKRNQPKRGIQKAVKKDAKDSKAAKKSTKKSARKGSGKKSSKAAKKSTKTSKAKKSTTKKVQKKTKRTKIFKTVRGSTPNPKKWLAVPSKGFLLRHKRTQAHKAKARARDVLFQRYAKLVRPRKSNPKAALRAIRRMIKFRRLRNRKSQTWAKRAKGHSLSHAIEEQLASGKILARITSRPGQSGKADGYVLEADELAFYLKKIEKKKAKGKR